MALYLAVDSVASPAIDVDLAADYLELSAFFASDGVVRTSDLANAVGLAATEVHVDLESEMEGGEEEIVSSAVSRIQTRERVLGSAYPFRLDDQGDVLECTLNQESLGHVAYLLSLVLSNLRSVSPVLNGSGLHPNCTEVRKLRRYFQYVATAALAAEVQGHAWSFGFPRPDGTGFLSKLQQIWQRLGDGSVGPQCGAPQSPKDDRIDVFAARPHPDGLPGFPLAAAQVATGKNFDEKSLRGHLGTFKSRWFRTQPVGDWMTYMIIPFARSNVQFVDDVRSMGNVLHRLRVPRRVAEARQLVDAGILIEGYCCLREVAAWITLYRERTGEAI